MYNDTRKIHGILYLWPRRVKGSGSSLSVSKGNSVAGLTKGALGTVVGNPNFPRKSPNSKLPLPPGSAGLTRWPCLDSSLLLPQPH